MGGVGRGVWRELHKAGAVPSIPYSNSDGMTRHILGELFAHRESLGVAEYRVLDVGASPRAHLSRIVANRMPDTHVTSMDLSAVSRYMAPNEEYVQADALNRAFPGKARKHAAILSAILEYLPRPKLLMRRVRQSLVTGGKAIVVLHGKNTRLAERMSREAELRRHAYETILACVDGHLSQEEALTRLEREQSWKELSCRNARHALQEVRENSYLQERLRGYLKNDVAGKIGAVASRIRATPFESMQDAQRFMEKSGFADVQAKPFEYANATFWVLSGRKLRRKPGRVKR